MKKTIIAVLIGAMLASCTSTPKKSVEVSNKQVLPNFNYVVEGGDKWGLVQAFEMNGKTFVQFLDLDRANPVFIGGDGEEIHYDRNGMYAMLDKSVPSFVVVSTYGRATVHTRATAPLPLAAVPSTLPPSDVDADVSVRTIDRATATVLQSALDLSARQLEELRTAEAQNVADKTVSRKLDLIEKRLALLNEAIESGNLPVLHVYFDDNSTAFIPDQELSALLVSAAGEADKVLVRGYTDSNSVTSAARKLGNL